MGQFIQLKAADGHQFSAWQEGPQNARVGLVLGQEIFGINHHIRNVCSQFAALGYSVISPALFDRVQPGVELGYTDEDIAKARILRSNSPDEKALLDIEAAAATLKGKKNGLVGYCWGGKLAWLSACRSKTFAATVGYYGTGTVATKDEKPNCPVQLHFGELDPGTPMSDVELIRQAQKARPDVEVYVYPNGQHGFGCDERKQYGPEQAKLARQLTVDFLAKHLA